MAYHIRASAGDRLRRYGNTYGLHLHHRALRDPPLKPAMIRAGFTADLLSSSAALAICGAAVMLDATREVLIATGYGILTLACVDAKEATKCPIIRNPASLELMPLRLRIAVQSDAFSDIELHVSVSRKVHLLFTHQQKSAIVAAYSAAPSGGRLFIEQTVREIDPSAVESSEQEPE